MNLENSSNNNPKRLLSIDGGGIRGIIAIKMLEKIETMIREEAKSDHLRLCDYFDFIGGTSTGAIIAAGLATGWSASDILNFYTEEIERGGSKIQRGKYIFKMNTLDKISTWSEKIGIKISLIRALIGGYKYNPAPLKEELKNLFKDTPLHREKLKTNLMIVVKNVTAGKPWFFVCHNKGRECHKANQDVLLRDVIYASCAIPPLFPPHKFLINIKKEDKEPLYEKKPQEFIDGGITTMFTNPALQLFLEATCKDYNIGWQRGKNELLLVSVGTGFHDREIKLGKAEKKNHQNG